jgi:hypothetical protein
MPAEDIAATPVKFLKNGDLTQEIDGAKVVIAHYDRKTKHLEFTTVEGSRKLMRQVTAAIGTIKDGEQSSGLVIETMGVKGRPRDNPTGKVPARPRRDPQYGDQTPVVVEWYFNYYPQEAYIRYGVFLDESDQPIRARVRRKLTETVDDRDGSYFIEQLNEGKGIQVGPKRWENGPIGQVVTQETLDDQIIARRATHMTFAPSEVVGGFDTGEDDDSGQPRIAEEDNE